MRQFIILLMGCIVLSLCAISCIDRDTIAGTGKEEPDRMLGAGGGFQFGIVSTKLINPIKVRVLAANGRPVRGIIVEFTVEKSNATFSDTTAVTDGNGYAQTFVTLGAKADSVFVYASVLGLKGSPVKFSLHASSSSATKVEYQSGNNQVGSVGNPLSFPLKVKVTDFFGNVVPNVPIYFTTLNGKISPSVILSDSFGLVSAVWTLDTLVGNKTAQALVPTIPNGTVNFDARANSLAVPSTFQYVSMNNFYTLQGTTINNLLQVKVLDKYGNPVYFAPPGGFPVKFNLVSGNGTVSPSTSNTNSSGIAVAGVTIASDDSVLRVRAEVGFGMPSLNFAIYAYQYFQIDSLTSSGGKVSVYWQKNLNLSFLNYTVQRCSNFNFDNTTVDAAVVTDENTTTTDDSGVVVSAHLYYRVKVNYSNGFSFYTNVLEVTVKP